MKETDGYGPGLRTLWAAILLPLMLAHGGCKGADPQPPPAPPPPEVSVMKLTPTPITVYDEYVGRTNSPDTIEIRARVSGILERQAFQDGALIKSGDLLYVIDQSPYQAALAQARANLVNAQQNLARQKRLVRQNLVSKQDYDAAVASAQANAALVEAQRALMEQAELNLGYTTIRAPRDGAMSKSLVNPGALIMAAQTQLATLYSIDPMEVYFSISEAKLLELQKQLNRPPGSEPDKAPPFRLRLIDNSEYKFPGRLNFVDAAVDEKTGTLQVRISVPNPDRFLRPGQFVRVVVPAFENPDAIRVPERAVQELQGLKSVYVVGVDNKAMNRQITARYRVNNDWVVEKGLAPGDVVIVEGTQKVHPGMPVKPVPFTESASVAQDGSGTGAGSQAPGTALGAVPGQFARPSPAPKTGG